MKVLHISESLDLPLDAATQTFAILGLRGSGKTNTAVDMLEEMLKVGQQIVWIDPVDVAWGIRSSRDGQASGFAITILGGEHGDVPLDGDSGKLIADFVIDNHASVILSLRHLSMNEQRQLATDFAERIYERKGKAEHRDALHIFVDECDEFVPQNIEQGKQRLFGAFDRLVRRGRSSGIGITLISQRPQVVNKSVLSQCETLICHRMLHKLERKAVDEWVQAHDTEGRRDVFMQSLASLARGEAWVWSPSWLDVFKKVRMRQRETFDSSATPVAGKQAVVPRHVAAVDLDALREKLKKTIDKSKENDPLVLRRRIRELEATRGVTPEELLAERNSANLLRDQLSGALERENSLHERLSGIQKRLRALILETSDEQESTEVVCTTAALQLKPETEWPKPTLEGFSGHAILKNIGVPDDPKPTSKLRAGAERMLACIAQWYPHGRSEAQVAAQVQMKRTGGTWAAYKSDLKTAGYLEVRNGAWHATKAGVAYFGGNMPKAPRTTEEVVALWEPKLRSGARAMLNVLVKHRGQPMSRERLGEWVEMEPSGGTFSAYLSDLRTAGLIITDGGAVRANAETLFL